MTQTQFGELVGISQPAVSSLVARGVLSDGDALGAWLLAYCDHLREIAAGRSSGGDLNLVAERARLASEQANRVAMQNAERRRELAPSHVIEEVLTKAGARAGRILDTIPGALKRRIPALSSDDVRAVATIVAKARNVAAALSIADLESDDDDDADSTRDLFTEGEP